MTDLKQRIAALSPQQRELLARRIGLRAARPAGITPVSGDVDPDGAPLTAGQIRLWDIHHRAPDTPINVACQVITLVGPLDIERLEQSFTLLVERHLALSTTFATIAGEPRQTWHSGRSIPIERLEISAEPGADRHDKLTALARKQAWQPFDVESGPLMRVALVRADASEHALLVSAHNLVFDAWSFGVMLDDLIALYNAGGSSGTLAELPVTYRDYVYWQKQWQTTEDYASQLAYWQKNLATPLPAPLPTDMERPPVPPSEGQRIEFTLPAVVTENLGAFARREGVTLFMVFAALVQALVHRRTGSDDVIIGTLNANRMQPDIERVIGYFLNIVLLRTDISGTPSFRELLARVRKVALDAQAHAQVPYEALIEAIDHERPPGCDPLFDVLFVYENVPPPKNAFTGLAMSNRDVDKGVARHDLTISVYQEPDRLHGWFEYRPALFHEATVRDMITELCDMAAQMVSEPATPVAASQKT